MSKLRFSPAMILVRTSPDKSAPYHYGIWVAENEVIHAMPGTHVTSVSFGEFADGYEVCRSEHTVFVQSPDDVIARARKEVGGRWRYELVEQNCEAFVLWCATGDEQKLGIQAATGVLFANTILPSEFVEPFAEATGRGPADLEDLHDQAVSEVALSAAILAYRKKSRG